MTYWVANVAHIGPFETQEHGANHVLNVGPGLLKGHMMLSVGNMEIQASNHKGPKLKMPKHLPIPYKNLLGFPNDFNPSPNGMPSLN